MSEQMEKRKPILSFDEVHKGSFTEVPWNSERSIGALNLWKWYEEKITKGELMVVKTVKAGDYYRHITTTIPANGILSAMDIQDIQAACCGMSFSSDKPLVLWPNFCPGCGAQIVA